MIKHILFDLDGTLLQMDNDEFAKSYFHYLNLRIGGQIDVRRFDEALLAATNVMVRDTDSSRTNEIVFLQHFRSLLGEQAEPLLQQMMEFYEDHFWQLRKVTRPSAAALQAVETALSGGDAVIATNPIFPRIATEQRLRWAGLNSSDFPLVTVYENSCFCKPNPAYYQEILEKMGWQADECLMVGNDEWEDLVAGKLGIRTCLVTDCLIPAKEGAPQADYRVALQELPQLLQDLLNA